MADTNHTPRYVRDILWLTCQDRNAEQQARIARMQAERNSASDNIYAHDAFLRQEMPLGFRAYAFIGQVSGAFAVVLFDECRETYAVSFNDTRFTSEELIEAVIFARLAMKQQKGAA